MAAAAISPVSWKGAGRGGGGVSLKNRRVCMGIIHWLLISTPSAI